MTLSWEDIRDRILANEIISPDFTALGIEDAFKDKTSSLPPITNAHFRLRDANLQYSTPSLTPSSKNRTYIKDFERLTLAMRCQALALKLDGHSQLKNSISTWSSSLRSESSDNISKGVHSAIEHLTLPAISKGDPAGPAALKLVGCIIDNDLDLSKLDIPFSIRLIGCHIKGALILDRSHVVTLDISGSVIDQGISGLYFHADGAIRARKTVSLGAIDFGGLETGGTFDFEDAILFPQGKASHLSSYVGDRGILNISGAKLDKDIRISRARIYGGINMRGANIGGMLHMNDVVLRSAQSHFEMLLTGTMDRPANSVWKAKTGDRSLAADAATGADKDIASILHPDILSQPVVAKERIKFLRELIHSRYLEILGGEEACDKIVNALRDSLQCRLMQESSRAAESALRAEGATFGGPIYARGVRICGRVKFKSSSVNGGVFFQGARLRTARSVRKEIDRLMAVFFEEDANGVRTGVIKFVIDTALRNTFYVYRNPASAFMPTPAPSIDEYALDFESATIKGSLDFGPHFRTVQQSRACDKKFLRRIAETVCKTGENPNRFTGLFIRNSVPKNDSEEELVKELEVFGRDYDTVDYEYQTQKDILQNIIREQIRDVTKPLMTELGKFPHKMTSKDPEAFYTNDKIQEIGESVCKNGALSSTLLLGEIRLDNSIIEGNVSFERMVANIFDHKKVDLENYNYTRSLITMRNVTINGDLDFRDSVGLSSVGAQAARIKGSVRFCDPVRYDENDLRYEPIPHRALFPHLKSREGVDGRKNENDHALHFERAQIEGDVYLLFDRETGPIIDVAFAKVVGKFQLMPAKFGVQMHPEDLERLYPLKPLAEHKDSNVLPRLSYGRHVIYSAFGQAKNLNEKTEKKVLDTLEAIKKAPCKVDLRHMTTSVLVHPPTAWPKQDGLILAGLKYEATKELGPLYPPWRSWTEVWRDIKANQEIRWPYRAVVLLTFLSAIIAFWGLFSPWKFKSKVDTVIGTDWSIGVLTIVAIAVACALGAFPNFIKQRNCAFLAFWLYIIGMMSSVPKISPIVEPIKDLIDKISHPVLNTSLIVTFGLAFLTGFLVWQLSSPALEKPDQSTSRTTVWRLPLKISLALLSVIGTFAVVNSPAYVQMLKASVGVVSNLGHFNLAGIAIIAIFCSIYFIQSYYTQPKFQERRSLAVRWLALQRRHFVTRRIFADTRPAQPYILAATILRAEGRHTSANEVEIQRLRQQTDSLSWRRVGIFKLILRGFDKFFGYGFAPARAFTVVIAYIFFSAAIFNWAHKAEVIVESVPVDSYQAYQLVTTGGTQVQSVYKSTDVKTSRVGVDDNTQTKNLAHFHSTLYAIDVFFPIINTGEADKWEVQDPRVKMGFGTPAGLQEFLYRIVRALRILGWVLISLLILSIVTRIEAVIARTGLV